MATRSSTTPAGPPSTDVGPVRPDRRVAWTLPVALLAVAVTFGVTVASVLSDVPESFRYGGDQAMTGLAVDEAGTFGQALGPYSRYGWSHPGPFWFYLLALPTRLLGGDDGALIAANVLLNGLLAAAVVVAVHRAGRPVLTLTVTALVVVFVLRMPSDMFVDPWSPFALLMGTLLFLVLAARVHSGTWPALLAMLIAGSFLVQTHIGTAPLVGLVGATGGVAFFLARRARRRTAGSADTLEAPRDEHPRRTVVLAVLLVAVWIPPIVQQLSSPAREGNLVRLATFFLLHEGEGARPTPGQATIAVGRLLAMAPYGWDAGPWEMAVDTLPAPVALALAGQVLASGALVVLGRRWGSPSGFWWGVVTLAALVAAIVSAATVTGVLFWYLIIWVSVLPLATAVGIAHLALDRRTPGREGAPDRRAVLDRAPVLAALAVVGLVLSGAAAMSLRDAVAAYPASTEASTAFQLVDDALADVEGREVHIDLEPHELWPTGAGVVRGLVSEGWTVTVDPEFTDVFGAGRAEADGGPVDVLFVPTDGRSHDRLREAAGVREVGALATGSGPVTVLLRVEG